MKVGIFLKNITHELGGAYSHETRLLRALAKHGVVENHSFIIISNDNLLPLITTEFKEFGFYLIRIKLFEKLKWSFLSKFYPVLKLLFASNFSNFHGKYYERLIEKGVKKAKVDFIISFNQTVPTKDIPYLLTLWDLEHRKCPFFPEVSESGLWKKREEHFSETLRRASVIVTGTKTGKAEIEKFYQVPGERIKVIPFPKPDIQKNLDEDETILSKYNLPPKFLFYPAQFWPHKNHINLLHSIHILKKDKLKLFDIVFVGSDKGNLSYVKDLANELGINDQVYFLGFVPQKDLEKLYQVAFAMVYITFFGPDNIPPLEAFALGCPVIASKIPGYQDQLGDAVMAVNPKDPGEIASAILTLDKDSSTRDKLISKGYKQVSMFSEIDYIQRLMPILDDFEPYRRCWKVSNKR